MQNLSKQAICDSSANFLKITILSFFLSSFLFSEALIAQTQPPLQWQEMAQKGVNFNEIKAAFAKKQGVSTEQLNTAPVDLQTRSNTEGVPFKLNRDLKHFMRWASFYEPRAQESNGDLTVIPKYLLNAFSQNAANGSDDAQWKVKGPINTVESGGNGRVNALRIHPTDDNTLFACTPVGGLWKSSNGGASWACISESIAVMGATDVAIDPTNPNNMYLATGDGDAADAFSTGVYKSTDGGNTWSPTGLTYGPNDIEDLSRFGLLTLSRILIDPTNPKVLIVGGTVGIFRSANAGETWVKVSNQPVKDLEFKPNDSKTVYAAGRTFLSSNDNGVTFTQNSQVELNNSNIGRIAIAVSPIAPNKVYLLACSLQDNGFLGFYTSNNSGRDFNLMSTSPNILGWETNGGSSGGQGFYDLAITISPTDSNRIYTGGVNTWQSLNGGSTWQSLTYWRRSTSDLPYVHADCHDLIFSGSTLYSANDGGVFKSLDNGKTWSDISSNLAIAQIYKLGLSASKPEMMVSGHQDNGINLTKDGKNWREIFGADGMECFIDRENDSNIYGSIYYGYFYRSTDGGATMSPFTNADGGLWITPWLQDPSNANAMYAGGYQVQKYQNGSWERVSNFFGSSINQLDVAKSDLILASNDIDKTIQRFNGTSWQNVTNNLPYLPCQALEIDDNNNKKYYAGFASYKGKSLFMSKDEGATWESYSQGLPDVPVNVILSVKGALNGDVYVGTDVGVYFRNNLLDSWIPFNSGLPGVPVTDMEIYKPLSLLRISTYGRGIWESPLRVDAATVIITSPKANTEFPNNGNISFSANAITPKGTVTKVEFYKDNVLVGTDETAPYSIELSSLSNGVISLTAKGFFTNPDTIATSSEVKITVANPRIDANLQGILAPSVLTPFPSSRPRVRIKNNGNVALTALNIVSQLDNFEAKTLAWTGNLMPLDTISFVLDSINYNEGKHKLMVSLVKPNGVIDENSVNDTASLAFEYRQCGEIFEPNNTTFTATPIPFDTKVYQPLSNYNDYDFYTFTATKEARAFEVALTNLPGSYNLAVSFDANSPTYYNTNFTTTDKIIKFSALPNQKVYIGISTNNFNNLFAEKCYTLEVKNLPVTYDIELEKIYRPADSLIASSSISPLVKVRNTGNVSLDSLTFSYKIDENTAKTYFWTGLLRPNDTVVIAIPAISDYTEGVHQLSISVNTPLSSPDSNLVNNTLSRNFNHQKNVCSDSDEPNNSTNFASYIPINTEVKSLLKNGQDSDFFTFETTNDAPILTARLYNLPIDANLILYRYNETYKYYESIRYSGNYGAQDEIIKYSTSVKGKYALEVNSYNSNSSALPQSCYSLKVTTSSAMRDIIISSIVTPNDLVATETFTPRFYLKNNSNVQIQNILLKYKIDNETEKVFLNTQFLNPSDSVLVTLGTFDNYTEGSHTFSIKAEFTDGLIDVDTTNNQKTVFFIYKKLCGNNYEPNNELTSATNIVLDSTYFAQFATNYDIDHYRFKTTTQKPIIDIFIKNESQDYFYINFYLLNNAGYYNDIYANVTEIYGVGKRLRYYTDQAGTYVLRLSNSSSNSNTNCYDFKVTTLPAVRDVALRTIAEPATDTINGPGITPSVFLSNLGNFAIKSVGFSYQIDDESEKTHTQNTEGSWYFSNDSNALFNIKLPSILGYSEGWHTLKVRVTTVNGSADENLNNNYLTKRFYYLPNGCADNFENGGNEFAHSITPNTTVKGMISTNTDYDRFTFTTTNAKPILKISLITPTNYGFDFRITDELGRYYYPSYEGTSNPNERIFNLPSDVGKKWFITIGNSYNSYFTVSDCYSLTVKTIAIEPDVAILSIRYPLDTVVSDAFIPYLELRNEGNATVSKIDFEYQIDSMPAKTITWKNISGQSDYPPLSNFTIPVGKINGYTEGAHKLRFKVKSINNLPDVDSTDNLITGKFFYKNTGCFDNYEPNDTITKAEIVPTDTLIQSVLSENDKDFFKFYTTKERPNFKLTFKNTNSNSIDLAILDKDGNYLQTVFRDYNYNLNESYFVFKGSKADTFYFRIINVYQYYSDYTKQGCYNFNIKTEGRNDAARLTAITAPNNDIIISSFTPFISIRNTGNTVLSSVLFDIQIDSLPSETFLWTLTTNDYPDYTGVWAVYLKKMTNYTEGVHTLNIRAKEINGYANQDTQKVLSKKFTYTRTGCDDNYEPNETVQTAYPVKGDSTYYAMYVNRADQDFYALTTEDPFAYYNVTFKTKNFAINPTIAMNFNNELNIIASEYVNTNSQVTMKVGIKSSQKAILQVQSYSAFNDDCYSFAIKKLPNSVDASLSFVNGQSPTILTTDSAVTLNFLAFLEFNLKLYNADFVYQVDGGPQKVFSWARPGNLSLYFNNIDLVIPDLAAGLHEVKVTLMNPNFGQDPNMSNNTITFKVKRFNADEIDAGIVAELNIPDTIRGFGVVTPKIVLKNFGKSALEQVNILTSVSINHYSGTNLVYTWYGKLLSGDSVTVFLNQFGLYEGVNDVKFIISSPNGLIKDSNVKNDTLRKRVLYNFQNTYNRQDIGISEMLKPKMFEQVVDGEMEPVIMVKNYSDSVIVNPIIRYRLDSNALSTFYTSLVFRPLESKEVKLPKITYSSGSHSFFTRVQLLYSEFDFNSTNDVMTSPFTYSTTSTVDLGIEKCQLFPNPTNGFLQLKWESKDADLYHFDVVDVTGRVLKTQSQQLSIGNQNVEWQVGDFPQGLYFIKISNSKGSAMLKFIKN